MDLPFTNVLPSRQQLPVHGFCSVAARSWNGKRDVRKRSAFFHSVPQKGIKLSNVGQQLLTEPGEPIVINRVRAELA